jgi:hypothetical protein
VGGGSGAVGTLGGAGNSTSAAAAAAPWGLTAHKEVPQQQQQQQQQQGKGMGRPPATHPPHPSSNSSSSSSRGWWREARWAVQVWVWRLRCGAASGAAWGWPLVQLVLWVPGWRRLGELGRGLPVQLSSAAGEQAGG